MKTHAEYEGKNVEQALENASRDLGVAKGQLKYDVIAYGSTGIFGLVGVKKAKVRVVLPKKASGGEADKDSVLSLVDEAFGATETKTNGKKGPSRKPAQKNGKPKAKPSPKQEKPAPKREARPNPKQEKAAPKTELRPAPKPKAEPRRQPKAEKPVPTREELAAVSEAPVREETLAEVTPEMVSQGREVLARILDLITEGATISEEISDGRILFNVEGGNSAVIIGKRGQTLEAIQYLTDKIVNKLTEERVRVQIDVEGYLETRKDHLRQLAAKQAEKAKRTGKPATIGQMNAHDRRIIHLTLKDDRGVRTQSIGEGYYRRLVIFPKKTRRRKSNQGEGGRR